MLRTLAPLLLLASVGCGGAEELPEILVVRDFTLTSHRGEPFAERSLEGHVWVASFVFTSCRDVCPLITNQVANLHRRVTDDRVRFVSIPVDPRVDTPEVLAAYRARYRADDRWVFLTGDPAEVRRVVTEIFRVSMGEPSSAEAPTTSLTGSSCCSWIGAACSAASTRPTAQAWTASRVTSIDC